MKKILALLLVLQTFSVAASSSVAGSSDELNKISEEMRQRQRLEEIHRLHQRQEERDNQRRAAREMQEYVRYSDGRSIGVNLQEREKARRERYAYDAAQKAYWASPAGKSAKAYLEQEARKKNPWPTEVSLMYTNPKEEKTWRIRTTDPDGKIFEYRMLQNEWDGIIDELEALTKLQELSPKDGDTYDRERSLKKYLIRSRQVFSLYPILPWETSILGFDSSTGILHITTRSYDGRMNCYKMKKQELYGIRNAIQSFNPEPVEKVTEQYREL